MKKNMSVCIVPYSVNYRNGGTVQFLLGREGGTWRESDKWSGFGGKLEDNERPEAGAAREMYEETCGVIDLQPALQQRLENHEYRLRVLLTYKRTQSLYFFMQIPYAGYPMMFRNAKTFVQYTHGNIDCIEKNMLQWFTYDELRGYILKTTKKPRTFGRMPYFRHKFVDLMRFVFSDEDNLTVLLSRTRSPKELEAFVVVENFGDPEANAEPTSVCSPESRDTVVSSGSEDGSDRSSGSPCGDDV